MSLEDELNAAQSQFNAVTFEVSTGTWDGPDIADPDVLEGCYQVDTSCGIDQINAAANLYFVEMPNIPINAPIQVFAGYNGQAAAVFKGEVSGKAWEFAPGKFVLPCKDRLARTRFGWAGVDREYLLQDDDVIIRNVLEAYGLPSDIAEIVGSGWQLGIVQAVTLPTSTPGWNLISEIDGLTTYRTYTDGLGVIRRKNIFSNITTPTWDFVETYNIVRISRKQEPLWPNQTTVNGLTYEEVPVVGTATATNDNIPTPPGTLADDTQSDLIETNEQATLAAQFLLTIKRAESERFELDTYGNPLIQPLDLIHLDCDSAGILLDSIVESVRHTITANSFLTTIRTFAILNADDATNGFDPIARITATIDQEVVTISGSPVTRYFVELDGSTSTDTDGIVVSYAWAVPGGDPSSGTGARFATVLDDLTGVVATLTVTDEQALTDNATLALDSVGPIRSRKLLLAGMAEGLVWLTDGAGTALIFARSGQECRAVPAISSGSPYAGWDDGVLTRVNADLVTLDTVYTFPAAIRCVFVNEGNPDHILVATATVVYRSTDAGATFATLTTFGVTVNDVQSSPTALNDIRVAAGISMWHSFDAVSFAPVATSVPGSEAMMLATAPWDNAVCFANAGSRNYVVRFEDSTAVIDWTGVTSPPTSLLSITPFLVGRGFLVGGDDGRTFALAQQPDGNYVATDATSALGSGNGTVDLQRDGDFDTLIYAAARGGSDDGAYKIVNKTDAYLVYPGDIAQIGYGDFAETVGVFNILWPTWGATSPGIHHLVDGVWTLIPFPLSGTYYFYGIAANRTGNQLLVTVTTNPTPRSFGGNDWYYHDIDSLDRFVMRGAARSPLWHYNLTTGIWTELFLDSPYNGPFTDVGGNGPGLIDTPDWAPDSDDHWILTHGADAGGGYYQSNGRWHGVGATVGFIMTELYTEGQYTRASMMGLDDDIIAYNYFGGDGFQLKYIPEGANAIEVGSLTDDTAGGRGRIDMLQPATDRATIIAMNTGAVCVTPDYRATTPTEIFGDNTGQVITAASHGVYLGNRSGVYQILDPLGSPSGSVVASSGVNVGWVRADRQQRLSVVANVATTTGMVGTLDGATWSAITGPAGAASDLGPQFEVLRV